MRMHNMSAVSPVAVRVEAASPVASRLGVRRGPILELTPTMLRHQHLVGSSECSEHRAGHSDYGELRSSTAECVSSRALAGMQEYVFRV